MRFNFPHYVGSNWPSNEGCYNWNAGLFHSWNAGFGLRVLAFSDAGTRSLVFWHCGDVETRASNSVLALRWCWDTGFEPRNLTLWWCWDAGFEPLLLTLRWCWDAGFEPLVLVFSHWKCWLRALYDAGFELCVLALQWSWDTGFESCVLTLRWRLDTGFELCVLALQWSWGHGFRASCFDFARVALIASRLEYRLCSLMTCSQWFLDSLQHWEETKNFLTLTLTLFPIISLPQSIMESLLGQLPN